MCAPGMLVLPSFRFLVHGGAWDHWLVMPSNDIIGWHGHLVMVFVGILVPTFSHFSPFPRKCSRMLPCVFTFCPFSPRVPIFLQPIPKCSHLFHLFSFFPHVPTFSRFFHSSS